MNSAPRHKNERGPPGRLTRRATFVRFEGVYLFRANTTSYDLTISDLHTYYVEAGNTPVLVHNCDVATEHDARMAMDRAEELQSGRNDYPLADKKGTTAVIGVWNSLEKKMTIRIGINGSGPMPANFALREGEEFVQAAECAESRILDDLLPHEHAIFGAASRTFYREGCLPTILDPNDLNVNTLEIGGAEIRGHVAQNSLYTLFWSPKGEAAWLDIATSSFSRKHQTRC